MHVESDRLTDGHVCVLDSNKKGKKWIFEKHKVPCFETFKNRKPLIRISGSVKVHVTVCVKILYQEKWMDQYYKSLTLKNEAALYLKEKCSKGEGKSILVCIFILNFSTT